MFIPNDISNEKRRLLKVPQEIAGNSCNSFFCLKHGVIGFLGETSRVRNLLIDWKRKVYVFFAVTGGLYVLLGDVGTILYLGEIFNSGYLILGVDKCLGLQSIGLSGDKFFTLMWANGSSIPFTIL